MRKVIKVVVGVLVCLALLGIQAGSVRATGEQSVKELIGRDGEYLALNEFYQKVWGEPDVDREFFGGDIAISGNNAIVSSVYYIYFFEKDTNGVWRKRQKFGALPVPFDSTGISNPVAIDGNVAIVGSTQKVYIFEKSSNGNWVQKTETINAPDGDIRFGGSIAISGNTIVVGTSFVTNEEANGPKSAYVYGRNADGSWKLYQKLVPTDPNATTINSESVAILGNIAMITAYNTTTGNSVCIFERDSNGIWNEKQRLSSIGPDPDDLFGERIAISGNYALIGAFNDSSRDLYDGSASIFKYDVTSGWKFNQEQSKIFSANEDSFYFGYNLAISGKYAVINGGTRGGVEVFKRDDNDFWMPYTSINADPESGVPFVPGGEKVSGFGISSWGKGVVADYDTLMISADMDAGEFPRGAPGAESGQEAGAVYFYPISAIDKQFKLSAFSIPTNKKYLIFVIAKTSEPSENAIKFEAVGLQRDAQNSPNVTEKTYTLSLEKSKYLTGNPYDYYIVDLAELKGKYLQECESRFGVCDGSTGDNTTLRVGLKIRYIAPVTSEDLKDVYVTDGGRIVDVKTDFGGASVSWTEIDANEAVEITGYQVDYTETPDPPQKGINDLPVLKVPYETKSGLSARKVYYVWVRTVNKLNQVSPWVSATFSPKPALATIKAISDSGSGTTGKPIYTVHLGISCADAAKYIIKRQESGNSATLQNVGEFTYEQMVEKDFKIDDPLKLEKHCKYQYFVYSMNQLAEISGKSNVTEIQVANISPQSCELQSYPRPLEVIAEVKFRLGPKCDIEGDPLTYLLYQRAPGVGNGQQIEVWHPETDNQEFSTSKFTNKGNYEWQVRCVETGISNMEVGSGDWRPLHIDTDAIIVVCQNASGIYNWGTKKQTLYFRAETNPNKTFTNFQWNFGDSNATFNGTSVSKIYDYLNSYIVTVIAIDENQIQRQGSQKIEIVNTFRDQLYDYETWPDGHTVEGEVIVPAGLTLTIAPGAQIQMKPAGRIKVKGKLEASDINGGIQFAPQAGTALWQGIEFKEKGWGSLTGVKLNYASTGMNVSSTGNISLNNVYLQNCNTGLDYYSGNLNATGCQFLNNNDYGLKDNNGESLYPILKSCVFEGNYMHYVDDAGLEYSQDDVNSFPSNGKDNVFKE